MRLISLALLMVCLLPGLAPGGSGTGQNARIQEAEVFLTELFTIDGHAEEIPMERRAAYLEERFGSFCEEEMLDSLMDMRLPFSIMQQAAEQGFDLSVADVALEVPEPVNEEADIKVNYRVSARRESFSGDSRETEITGRLTLDREDGRIQSIRVDNLDKLLEE